MITLDVILINADWQINEVMLLLYETRQASKVLLLCITSIGWNDLFMTKSSNVLLQCITSI